MSYALNISHTCDIIFCWPFLVPSVSLEAYKYRASVLLHTSLILLHSFLYTLLQAYSLHPFAYTYTHNSHSYQNDQLDHAGTYNSSHHCTVQVSHALVFASCQEWRARVMMHFEYVLKKQASDVPLPVIIDSRYPHP